jgi:predicted AAA+ superfamily ATPase
MIARDAQRQLEDLAQWYPVIAITGPRQSGKTTLARKAFPAKPYVSLEDPDTRETALADPRRFLAQFDSGAVIDEAQRAPEIFSFLQTRVDQDRHDGKTSAAWVLTGSQHFGLIAPITQSLAGRVGLLHLLPFSLGELQKAKHGLAGATIEELLWHGLYPPVVDRGIPPSVWYADYFATYVERDVRQLVNVRDLAAFRTFVRMCAARTAQAVHLSALAADCGISTNTAKGWLSILEASYIAYTLPQHHANYGKRLVKAPKLYFYDTGLAAWLAGLRSAAELGLSSLRGPLFETWAIGEVLKTRSHHRLAPTLHYWRDKLGVEIDLLIDGGTRLVPMEFKAGQTVAGDWVNNLRRYLALAANRAPAVPVEAPVVVYGGDAPHVRDGIDVIGWRALPERAFRLLGGTETPASRPR